MNTPTVPTVPTAPTAVVNEVPTVPTATTVPTAVNEVPTATEGGEIATDTTKKKKGKSKTERWNEVQEEVTAILLNEDLKAFPNVQSLITKVIENYKPKSGGGQDKDWSRRVETSLGELLSKQCVYTGLFYKVDDKNPKSSSMSKGKYTTKKLLEVIRDAKKEATAEMVATVSQGQAFTDVNKLTLVNPNSGELADYEAVLALYPDKVAGVANDYATLNMYLGATQAEAVTSLHGLGLTDTKISE